MAVRGPLIGVSGQIGAGKSTLVDGLAAELQFVPLFERELDNPYLRHLYSDPPAWALRNLLFFFEQSVTDQVHVNALARGIVQERLPDEHLYVFGEEYRARGFLSCEDMALLERLRELVAPLSAPPELLIHLDVDADTAFRRVRHRARKAEGGISLAYLEALGRRYDQFIEGWSHSPVLRLDSTQLDFRDSYAIRLVASDVVKLIRAVRP